MNHPVRLSSRNAEETRRLGQRLGALLRPGDVVLLSGELGAGKTTFVQGLARGLGFEGPVSSKSFVILGEYAGRIALHHADLYRLEDPGQVQDLALDELSADGVLVVEWPERAEYVLPPQRLLVRFEVASVNRRVLHLEPSGPRAEGLAAAMGKRRL